jgi:hypothetical protein
MLLIITLALITIQWLIGLRWLIAICWREWEWWWYAMVAEERFQRNITLWWGIVGYAAVAVFASMARHRR